MAAGLALATACLAEDAVPGAQYKMSPKVSSLHTGLFHPNGVNAVGYSVEQQTRQGLYWFYTMGFPSLAAIGLSYYDNHGDAGLFATGGIGIGSILYGSLGYQWTLGNRQYIKAGAGLTAGIAYEGPFPVLSYERRLE
jgi:hypothetical protein